MRNQLHAFDITAIASWHGFQRFTRRRRSCFDIAALADIGSGFHVMPARAIGRLDGFVFRC